MAKKTITVQGVPVRITDEDYVSLTDIAKQSNSKPAALISSWLKNSNTLLFLETWESIYNPDFKVHQMVEFKMMAMDNRNIVSPKNYIEVAGGVGIISQAGRHGGTYAHKDIALEFCSWLNPAFKVWMNKTFQELLAAEFDRRSLEWHISKITDNIDEVRNLLDTIPFQQDERNRLKNKI